MSGGQFAVEDAQLQAFCEQLRRAFTADIAICLVRRPECEDGGRTFTGMVMRPKAYGDRRQAVCDAASMLIESAHALISKTSNGRVLVEFDGQQYPVGGIDLQHFVVEELNGK